ncbi:hypothetical protein ABFX02_09G123500 [Erythranthe guttata]
MAFLAKLLLVSLLSIGVTATSAQVGIFGNVTLAGVITCPNDSLATLRIFRIIPEAKVDVVCGILFFQRTVKSTTTNLIGVYSFSFSFSDILLNNPELCYLNVTLPSNSCTFDPPGGAIRFPIVGIRSVLGTVSAYIPGAPSYLPV